MIKQFRRMYAALLVLFICCTACKKSVSSNDSGDNNNGGSNYPVITDSVYNPSDPLTPATIGFFVDTWAAKSLQVPAPVEGTVPTSAATDSLTINVNKVLVKVPPFVYGNNSNLWMGQIV